MFTTTDLHYKSLDLSCLLLTFTTCLRLTVRSTGSLCCCPQYCASCVTETRAEAPRFDKSHLSPNHPMPNMHESNHLPAYISLFHQFVVDRLPGRSAFQDVDVKDCVIIRRHGRLEHAVIRLEECVTRTSRLEGCPLPTPLS